MTIPRAAPLYSGALYKFYDSSVALRSTVPVFFGNLFFLQSIASPFFGSNGPLWSLSYEFWYYILFPVIVLALTSWVGGRFRVGYAIFAFMLFGFIGTQLGLYFLIWLAGVLVGRLRQHTPFRTSSAALPFAASLVFLGALAWCRTHRLPSEFLTDGVVAACFALWLYTLLLGAREDASAAYARVANKLAGFSYTLYLAHFPALLLLRGLLNPRGDWQPDGRHLLYALGIGLLILGYAYVLAEFTEARTSSVKDRLLRPRVPAESRPRA
jgi:peptidoglycan/LPS O-acetylase OafA/YrhL